MYSLLCIRNINPLLILIVIHISVNMFWHISLSMFDFLKLINRDLTFVWLIHPSYKHFLTFLASYYVNNSVTFLAFLDVPTNGI